MALNFPSSPTIGTTSNPFTVAGRLSWSESQA